MLSLKSKKIIKTKFDEQDLECAFECFEDNQNSLVVVTNSDIYIFKLKMFSGDVMKIRKTKVYDIEIKNSFFSKKLVIYINNKTIVLSSINADLNDIMNCMI